MATQIEAAIDAGDIPEAIRLLNSIPDEVVNIRAVRTGDWGGGYASARSGRLAYSAHGRFVSGGTNMISSLGERSGTSGDEVVLPLGDPARMSALLGLSDVGPRVAAAFGNMTPAPALSSGHAGGGDTYKLTVHNNGRDLTSDDLVRAFSKLRRSAA